MDPLSDRYLVLHALVDVLARTERDRVVYVTRDGAEVLASEMVERLRAHDLTADDHAYLRLVAEAAVRAVATKARTP